MLATTECAVVVCGRSLGRAQSVIDALSGDTERLSAAVVDRASATAGDVKVLGAFCVIDAAGPFQAQAPSFARAVIEAGAHYVDLADARDFVASFEALNDLATAHGVLAVTGASSTPALSHAVIDDVTRGWTRIDAVEIAISPGNRSVPLGLSVMRSILSYVGRPVRVWRYGRWTEARGWGLTVRRRMGDLGARLLSLVETPDLDLVPRRFPTVRHAIFRAGLELSFLHAGLMVLALLVRSRLMRSLTPLAEALRDAAKLFQHWGSDCGGMTVDVSGVYADGAGLHVTWTLIAESGDGPKIPTLPALAIVRRLLDGRLAVRGALPCVGLLELKDIEDEFKRLAIRTERETRSVERTPLFQRALRSFDAMPAVVRAAHAVDPAVDLWGCVDVEGASNLLARLIGRIFAFPPAGEALPAEVTIEREGDGEVWIRRFGGREFRSTLGPSREGLTERFGPITFDLDAHADRHGFSLAIVRARIGQMPLPRFLTPDTHAAADVDQQGRYRFDVTISLPFCGQLVGYRGWLEPVKPGGAVTSAPSP